MDDLGFRMPPPVPAASSGDDAFDAAIETLRKRCASLANKGEWGPPKLPPRLAKPVAGATARVIAMLPPDAFDAGESTYDLERGSDKAYLAAWRKVMAEVGPKVRLVSVLVALALRDEEGEAHVRAHLPSAMRDPDFAKLVNDAMLASPRLLDPETLRIGLRALENESRPWQEMAACWESGAKVALALGPEIAVATLVPHLSSNRAKTIGETLERERTSLEAAWRDPLVALGKQNHERALRLLTELPPDAEILELIEGALSRSPVPVPMWSQYLATHRAG